MLRTVSTFALGLTFGLAACTAPDPTPTPSEADEAPRVEYVTYGEEIAEDGLALRPSDLVAEPNTYNGQSVRVEGEIVEVCQNMGCWISLRNPEGGPPVRIHVPRGEDGNYLWTFPTDLGVRRAIIEGTANADSLSVDELRHYAEDAGAPAEEVAAITQPELTISVTARGALVEQPQTLLPPAPQEPRRETDQEVPVAGADAREPLADAHSH